MLTMTDTQIQPRLKVHLLQGKKITTLDGLKMFSTMRLSEYIRRLRKSLTINCDMVTDPKTGKRYGVYYIPKTTKKCKI